MVKTNKIITIYGLEQHFPRVYKINSRCFSIGKLYQTYTVGGYTSKEAFSVGVEKLYNEDFKRFIAAIHKLDIVTISDIIDDLILQIKKKISALTHYVVVDGLRYESFLRPQIVKPGDEDLIEKKRMIVDVEPYVKEFVSQMNQLVQELVTVKTKYMLGENDNITITAPIPDSFQYKNFKGDPTSKEYAKLKDLLSSLAIEAKYVDRKTSIKNFTRIFSNKPIDKPVVWIQVPTYLSYFIKTLISKGKIEKTANKHFFIADKCFVNEHRKHFGQEVLAGLRPPAEKIRKQIEDMVNLL